MQDMSTAGCDHYLLDTWREAIFGYRDEIRANRQGRGFETPAGIGRESL